MRINNQKELEKLLTANGIDTSQWGAGETKQVRDLWHEIDTGESHFQVEPFQRLVQVAIVVIRRGNNYLVEAEQEFTDGRRRKRCQPPADKIKPGENIQEAVMRCLIEELRVKREHVKILADTHRTAQSSGDSPSYPGLLSRFTYHYVDALVSDLPDDGFWIDNLSGAEDPIKRHYWKWVPAESVELLA